LVVSEFSHLVKYRQLDSPPGLKEIQLRSIQVRFDELMNALASRCDHILEVKILINPSFNKLRFVEVKPRFNNVRDLPSVGRGISLFELLKPLFECFLVFRCHELMPVSVEVLPLLGTLRLLSCIIMEHEA
jgi:hypothetical protein